ncbi:bestrophin-like domain [Streptomyces albireticuli]|uniref:DUF4239 domain-containing protein n=1 Tax=Streptomyces albireticuli TaxID=1940 RepID=A0A2A2DDU6_9ACTN|nr:DUF4239 domain-containing protein [Streptomyces albireticuli]MCD9141848.1 DUF4239 domain-containing protein [Streptomyces albireticuli]MCD9163208.1 DUF4239 domain-containing protein [Streptomyces albireticuli]MCD9190021.1 DUF4239 domain-containing protein [Streptomyces albireticuli]PAU50633.1 hypothetical protein CK936_01425 [Streptomyces albireticuli]
MQLWLLNTFSTPVLVVILVGGLTGLTLVGARLLHRRFPTLAAGTYNEAVGLLLGIFSAIYGIILAFVIVNLWTQMETSQTVVATEATDLSQIVRDIQAFPPEPRGRIGDAVSGYVHAVVEDQWPRMKRGHASYAATTSKLDEVYTALQEYEPDTQARQAFYEQTLDRLNDVAAQRRARIAQSSQQLPLLFQILVFGGALVVLATICLFGSPRKSVQMLFLCSVTVLIGFSLLLVVVLDCPFSGDYSIGPQPYKQGVLESFW